MQKIIINFGLGNVDIIKVDMTKNKCEVIDHKGIDCEKVYTANGTIDIKRAVSEIKTALGKDIELDVSIILPDYMTRVKLFELEDLTKQKLKDLKESFGNKLVNKQVSYIGKNSDYNMTQVILYNKKHMSSFIKEMHKQRINVVEVVSNFCALENSLPLVTNVMESIDNGGSKNYLMIIVGTNSICTMVMKNNMPLYIKNHSYNLYNLYLNLRDLNNDLEFSDFIGAIKRVGPYEEADNIQVVNLQKEESKDDEGLGASEDLDLYNNILDDGYINDKYDDIIAKELRTFVEMLCQEIRDLTDLVNEKFGENSIEIVTNSKILQAFINYQLSDIFNVNENTNLSKILKIGDFQIESETIDLDLDSIESLGLVICNMKKEAEFYE